jgi:hypothetical protein
MVSSHSPSSPPVQFLGSTIVSSSVEEWFEAYLRKTGKKAPKSVSFTAIEQTQGFKLPSSYKEFVTKIGKKTFKNMDGEEGFHVRILPPEELNFTDFRKTSNWNTEKPNEERIDRVIFATTEHGDVLCFDVTKGASDYPIYLYDHEMGDFEPFTTNFASCIKRLAHGIRLPSY